MSGLLFFGGGSAGSVWVSGASGMFFASAGRPLLCTERETLALPLPHLKMSRTHRG